MKCAAVATWVRRTTLFGATLVGLCLSCQDSYPISATACDEWCEASQALECGNYDPAACVAGCELAHYDSPACRAQLRPAISCLRTKTPTELACTTWNFNPQDEPCFSEVSALVSCGASGMPQL